MANQNTPDYEARKRSLYGDLKSYYKNIEPYEKFAPKLDDAEKRRRIFDNVSKKFDMGDYAEFEKYMGYTLSDVAPIQQEQQAQQTQSPTPAVQAQQNIGTNNTVQQSTPTGNAGGSTPQVPVDNSSTTGNGNTANNGVVNIEPIKADSAGVAAPVVNNQPKNDLTRGLNSPLQTFENGEQAQSWAEQGFGSFVNKESMDERIAAYQAPRSFNDVVTEINNEYTAENDSLNRQVEELNAASDSLNAKYPEGWQPKTEKELAQYNKDVKQYNDSVAQFKANANAFDEKLKNDKRMQQVNPLSARYAENGGWTYEQEQKLLELQQDAHDEHKETKANGAKTKAYEDAAMEATGIYEPKAAVKAFEDYNAAQSAKEYEKAGKLMLQQMSESAKNAKEAERPVPSVFATGTASNGLGVAITNYQQTERGKFYTAENIVSGALQHIENYKTYNSQRGQGWAGNTASGIANTGRGFYNTITDLSTWDFGITDLSQSTMLLAACKKFNNEEELTEGERAILDASAYQMAVQGALNTGLGFQAGEVTGYAIPFMIQMMVSPEAQVGNSVGATVARWAMKGLFKKGAETTAGKLGRIALKRVIKYGTQIIANDIRGNAMALNPMQIATTAAGIQSRKINNIDGAIGEDGVFHADKVDFSDDSWTETLWKGIMNQGIENSSEFGGDTWIGDITDFLWDFSSRKLRNTRLGRAAHNFTKRLNTSDVGRFFGRMKDSDYYKVVSELRKRSHISGIRGEVDEEIYGGIAKAALGIEGQMLSGYDNNGNWQNGVFSIDNYSETFMTMLPMQVMFGMMGMGGYGVQSAVANREKKGAIGQMKAAFYDGHQPFIDMIDSFNEKTFGEELKTLLSDPSLSMEQKTALLRYATATQFWRGTDAAIKADQAHDIHEKVFGEAYQKGYDMTDPDEQKIAYALFQDDLYYLGNFKEFSPVAERKKREYEKMLAAGDYSSLFEAMTEDGCTEMDRKVMERYITSRQIVAGINAALEDKRQEEISAAAADVSKITDNDGNVVEATLFSGEHGYVMSNDGENAYILKDGEETPEPVKVSQLFNISQPVPASAVFEEKIAPIEEKYNSLAQEIDGDVESVSVGEDLSKYGLPATVSAVNGDNFSVVFGDGTTKSFSIDDLKSIIRGSRLNSELYQSITEARKLEDEVLMPNWNGETLERNPNGNGAMAAQTEQQQQPENAFVPNNTNYVPGMDNGGEGSTGTGGAGAAQMSAEMRALLDGYPVLYNNGTDNVWMHLGNGQKEEDGKYLVEFFKDEELSDSTGGFLATMQQIEGMLHPNGVETPEQKAEREKAEKEAEEAARKAEEEARKKAEEEEAARKKAEEEANAENERNVDGLLDLAEKRPETAANCVSKIESIVAGGYKLTDIQSVRFDAIKDSIPSDGGQTGGQPSGGTAGGSANGGKTGGETGRTGGGSSDAPNIPTGTTTGGGRNTDVGANNTVFTKAMKDEALARLRAKMKRLNSGIDPSSLADYMIVAGCYFEDGIRKIAEFAKTMITELGEGVKPYIKQVYMAAKHDPKIKELGIDKKEFSSEDEVDEFDVDSISVSEDNETEDLVGKVGKAIKEKWAAAKKKVGNKKTETFSGQKYKGHYYLVEAESLTPSHDPNNGFKPSEGFPTDENGKTINDRDYEHSKTEQDGVTAISTNYNGEALTHMPVVSPDGIPYSGNKRTMASQIAAKNGTDSEYIESLKDNLETYGFDEEELAEFEHPRVVFVLDEELPYDTATFAIFNKQAEFAQSNADMMVKLGKILDDATFNAMMEAIASKETFGEVWSDNSAVNTLIKALQSGGILTQAEYARFVDGDSITDEGKKLIANALLGKVLEGRDEVVRALNDEDASTLLDAVTTALPQMAANKALGEEYSLMDEIADAIRLAYDARKNGVSSKMPITSHLKQQELEMPEDGEENAEKTENNPQQNLDPIVIVLGTFIHSNKTSALREFLIRYNKFGIKNNNPAELSVSFEDLEEITVDQRIKAYLKDAIVEMRKEIENKPKQTTSDKQFIHTLNWLEQLLDSKTETNNEQGEGTTGEKPSVGGEKPSNEKPEEGEEGDTGGNGNGGNEGPKVDGPEKPAVENKPNKPKKPNLNTCTEEEAREFYESKFGKGAKAEAALKVWRISNKNKAGMNKSSKPKMRISDQLGFDRQENNVENNQAITDEEAAELEQLGIQLGKDFVEAGDVKFADFFNTMVNTFGDGIRQFTKSIYMGISAKVSDEIADEMDDRKTVRSFDINSEVTDNENEEDNESSNDDLQDRPEAGNDSPVATGEGGGVREDVGNGPSNGGNSGENTGEGSGSNGSGGSTGSVAGNTGAGSTGTGGVSTTSGGSTRGGGKTGGNGRGGRTSSNGGRTSSEGGTSKGESVDNAPEVTSEQTEAEKEEARLAEIEQKSYESAKENLSKENDKEKIKSIRDAVKQHIKEVEAQKEEEWKDKVAASRGVVRACNERIVEIINSQGKEKTDITKEKVAYVSASDPEGIHSIGSVVPSGIAEAMQNAIKQVEKAEGMPIADFVCTELGYKDKDEMFTTYDEGKETGLAGEQVDSVGQAIHKMKNGGGYIIGDQTGVGKGRQAAALIRWGVKHGKKVLFVTKNAPLFSDMYRDMVDIGSGELRPLVINDGKEGHITAQDGSIIIQNANAQLKRDMYNSGTDALPTDKKGRQYDFVMMTYSQIASSKGTSGRMKSEWIREYAKDAIVILDEAHEASGSSNTGAFFKEVVSAAGGVTFLSATYAKRPENMGLYAIKSSLGEINMSQEDLFAAIEQYGVPMQEILASGFFSSGEMCRRERDMSDVETHWLDPKEVFTEKEQSDMRQTSDRTMQLLNEFIEFQRTQIQPIIEKLEKSFEKHNAQVSKTGGLMKHAQLVPVSGQTSNILGMMVYGLKCRKAAEMAIAQIKDGKKPVIAVENTLGAYVDALANDEEIDDISFAKIFERQLKSLVKYKVVYYAQDPDTGKWNVKAGEENYDATVDDGISTAYLKKVLQEYRDEKDKIEISISPVDTIKEMIAAAGYRCGEITGRQSALVSTPSGKHRKEKIKISKKEAASRFNGGSKEKPIREEEKYDALIVNVAGATGISLHASKRFADDRQRTMIILQPARNVDTEVQMRGRIDRTGQLHRGEYFYLTSPIPAEQKIIMMLKQKLASLDANSVGTEEVSSNKVDSTDMDNKYGDEVAKQILVEDKTLHKRVEYILGQPDKTTGEYKTKEGLLYELLKKLQRLDCATQERVLEELAQRYEEQIEYLNQNGINDLKSTTKDIAAETIDKAIMVKGKNEESENTFAHNTNIERVEANVLKKPLRSSDITKKMKKLGSMTTEGSVNRSHWDEVNEAARRGMYEILRQLSEKHEEELRKLKEMLRTTVPQQDMTDEEYDKFLESWPSYQKTKKDNDNEYLRRSAELSDQVMLVEQATDFFRTPGKACLVPITDDVSDNAAMMYGRFIGFDVKDGKPRNIRAIFAVKDSRAQIDVPVVSHSEIIKKIIRDTRYDLMLDEITAEYNDKWDKDYTDEKNEATNKWWDEMIPEKKTRQIRFMITGNILQACGTLGKHKGQIVSFTRRDKETGDITIEKGMLLAENFDPENFKVKKKLTKEDLWKDYKEHKDETHDISVHRSGDMMIIKFGKGSSKKLKDHPVNKDSELQSLFMRDIVPYRDYLEAYVDEENVETVLQQLYDKYAFTADELFVMPDSTEKVDAIVPTGMSYEEVIKKLGPSYGGSLRAVEGRIAKMLKQYKMDMQNEKLKERIREAVQLRQAYLRKLYSSYENNLLAWEAIVKLEEAEDAMKIDDKDAREWSYNRAQAIIEELEFRGFKGTEFHFKQGNWSKEDLKDLFYKLNKDEQNKETFERILKILESLDMDIIFNEKIKNDTGGQAAGRVLEYNWKYMNADFIADQAKADTILHEMTHTVTAYVFRLLDSGMDHLLTNEVISAANEIIAIFNEIKNNDAFEHIAGESSYVDYGVKNEKELMSEIASNEQFREDLKKVEVLVKAKSGFLVFYKSTGKNTVAGAKVMNAFDLILERFNVLLENFDKNAWSEYWKGSRYGRYSYRNISGNSGNVRFKKRKKLLDMGSPEYERFYKIAGNLSKEIGRAVSDTAGLFGGYNVKGQMVSGVNIYHTDEILEGLVDPLTEDGVVRGKDWYKAQNVFLLPALDKFINDSTKLSSELEDSELKDIIDDLVEKAKYAKRFYTQMARGNDVLKKGWKRPAFRRSDGRFSVSTGRPEIDKAIDDVAKSLNADVRVVNNYDSLPPYVKRAFESGAAVGYYDVNTGSVVLNGPFIKDADDAVRTVLHEVLGHKGLRAVFGQAKYDKKMHELFNALPAGERMEVVRKAMALKAENKTKGSYRAYIAEAMDEYLAEAAENGAPETISWFDKAVAAFKDILRSLGINVKLTPDDIAYMLWKSGNALKKGKTPWDKALRDVKMQKKYGTGLFDQNRNNDDDPNDPSPNGGGPRGRFRKRSDAADKSVAGQFYAEWNKGVMAAIDEAWHDMLRSLNGLQKAVTKQSGKKLEDFQNSYLMAMHLSSKNKAERDMLLRKYVEPMFEFVGEFIKRHNTSKDEMEKYLIAKHGKERNEAFARRDADRAMEAQGIEQTDPNYMAEWQKAYDEYRKKDYAGLTETFREPGDKKKGAPILILEERAERYVNLYEGEIGTEDIDTLWSHIHGISEFTLKKSYESGMMSRTTYDRVKSQFEWYVPLRGWEETTAGEVYDYLDDNIQREALQQTLKNAYGRKSRAGDILETMCAMAHSASAVGNKNMVKQALLRLAESHETPLITVTKMWYIKNGSTWDVAELPLDATDTIFDGKPYKDMAYEDMTTEDKADFISTWEEDMRSMAAAGNARESGKGLRISTPITDDQIRQHQVRVRRNGKEYIININGSPKAAQAITGKLNADNNPNWLDRLTGYGKRMISRMYTSMNPEFLFRNIQRDFISAVNVSGAKYGSDYAVKLMNNFRRVLPVFGSTTSGKYGGYSSMQGAMDTILGIGGLYTKLRNDTLNESNEIERLFKEFIENGGETGYSQLWTVDDYEKRMKAAVKRATRSTGGKIVHAPFAGLHAIATGISSMNEVFENATRFAVYMTSRQMGKSILQSVNDAKEASTNFNKKGSGALGNRLFRNLFVFANASIQGTMRYIEMLAGRDHYTNDTAIKKNLRKRALASLSVTIGLGAMTTVLNYMIAAAFIGSGDDDDEKEGIEKDLLNPYWRIGDYKRRNNLLIYTGSKSSMLTISLSVEEAAAFGIGSIIAERALGHNVNHSITSEIVSQMSRISPFGSFDPEKFSRSDLAGKSSELASHFVGSYPKIYLDAFLTNRDFMGNDIAYRTTYNEDKPEYTRVRRGTPEYQIRWSERLYDQYGIDVNPNIADYIIKNNFGGLYSFPKKVFEFMSNSIDAINGDYTYSSEEIPVSSVFRTQIDAEWQQDRALRAEFDWYKYDIDRINSAIKAMNDKGKSEAAKERLKKRIENDEAYFYWKVWNSKYDIENSFEKVYNSAMKKKDWAKVDKIRMRFLKKIELMEAEEKNND